MKNNIAILIIGIIFYGIIVFSLGMTIGKRITLSENQPRITERVSPAERQFDKTLLMVRRNPDMKKGQFVYIHEVLGDYLVVKKLSNINYPSPATPIYAVRSFDGAYAYIKLIAVRGKVSSLNTSQFCVDDTLVVDEWRVGAFRVKRPDEVIGKVYILGTVKHD